MHQPGSSAQRDRSCPAGEEARVGLTDAGQARYRRSAAPWTRSPRGWLKLPTSCLLARARWKLPLLCRYFFLVGRLAGRVSAPVCEEHASGANPEGRGL